MISSNMCLSVVPYVGTWIEINEVYGLWEAVRCRSLRGNVDRNENRLVISSPILGRSLRGNVDRNNPAKYTYDASVTSFPTWERG